MQNRAVNIVAAVDAPPGPGRTRSRWCRLSGLVLASLLLGSCSTPDVPPVTGAKPAAGEPPGEFRLVEGKPRVPRQWITPSDSHFRYEGRIESTNDSDPVIIWQASRIRIDFEGDELALQFDRLDGQSFFDVRVDNRTHLLAIREDRDHQFVLQPGPGPGTHHLSLFKRSEAAAGIVRFKGMEIATDARVQAPSKPAYRLAMEFIGDSITVGACDQDGETDQWEDRSTHNNALSYAALTAAAFAADYRNTAVSGMGVVTGWVSMRAGETWDRLYPNTRSGPADLEAWKPDVVFVNLGENDDSFSNAHQQPFPPDFADAYVSLIRSIRQAYPRGWIVLLRGGMYGGAQSVALREAWERAAARLEAEDRRLSRFVFTHWSKNHPRAADHRVLADELIAWLKQQPFLEGKVPRARGETD